MEEQKEEQKEEEKKEEKPSLPLTYSTNVRPLSIAIGWPSNPSKEEAELLVGILDRFQKSLSKK